jgi:hypothetical protein
MFAEPIISSIWYYDSSFFRLDGSKGKIGRITE